jgi:hypothetical protein
LVKTYILEEFAHSDETKAALMTKRGLNDSDPEVVARAFSKFDEEMAIVQQESQVLEDMKLFAEEEASALMKEERAAGKLERYYTYLHVYNYFEEFLARDGYIFFLHLSYIFFQHLEM